MTKDKNNIPNLIANLKKAEKTVLKVGIFNEEVALYASANEYGVPSKNIPERSFLRATFDEKKTQESILTETGKLYEPQEEPGKIINGLGSVLVAAVKRTMTTKEYKPNTVETIRRKGEGKKPLYDTGTMFKSVTFKAE